MISEKSLAKKYCSGDVTEIENYEKVVADPTQKWECHHRKELTEDGEFQYSFKDLKKMKEYYKRPPEELIFLTRAEHQRLHSKANKGKKRNYIREKYYLKDKDKFEAYDRAFLEKRSMESPNK